MLVWDCIFRNSMEFRGNLYYINKRIHAETYVQFTFNKSLMLRQLLPAAFNFGEVHSRMKIIMLLFYFPNLYGKYCSIIYRFINSKYFSFFTIQSFRRMSTTSRLQLVSTAHIMMYPYFLYPLQAISLTASIFMTVVIALERYNAISKPFDYR